MRQNRKNRQNQRMKIQNTLNRFKTQFSDRKHFSKSRQRIHSNNAARVCDRLRLLTPNQVWFSKLFSAKWPQILIRIILKT